MQSVLRGHTNALQQLPEAVKQRHSRVCFLCRYTAIDDHLDYCVAVKSPSCAAGIYSCRHSQLQCSACCVGTPVSCNSCATKEITCLYLCRYRAEDCNHDYFVVVKSPSCAAGIHSCSAERAAWAHLCLATATRGCPTETHGRAVPQQHGCRKKNRESAKPAGSDCVGGGTAYREAAGDASAVCQQQ